MSEQAALPVLRHIWNGWLRGAAMLAIGLHHAWDTMSVRLMDNAPRDAGPDASGDGKPAPVCPISLTYNWPPSALTTLSATVETALVTDLPFHRDGLSAEVYACATMSNGTVCARIDVWPKGRKIDRNDRDADAQGLRIGHFEGKSRSPLARPTRRHVLIGLLVCLAAVLASGSHLLRDARAREFEDARRSLSQIVRSQAAGANRHEALTAHLRTTQQPGVASLIACLGLSLPDDIWLTRLRRDGDGWAIEAASAQGISVSSVLTAHLPRANPTVDGAVRQSAYAEQQTFTFRIPTPTARLSDAC